MEIWSSLSWKHFRRCFCTWPWLKWHCFPGLDELQSNIAKKKTPQSTTLLCCCMCGTSTNLMGRYNSSPSYLLTNSLYECNACQNNCEIGMYDSFTKMTKVQSCVWIIVTGCAACIRGMVCITCCSIASQDKPCRRRKKSCNCSYSIATAILQQQKQLT